MILLFILVWGLLAGWLANIILGGSSHPQDWTPLLVAGFAGSLVGGTILNLITGNGFSLHFSGIFGSILGAVIVLGIYRAMQSRQA